MIPLSTFAASHLQVPPEHRAAEQPQLPVGIRDPRVWAVHAPVHKHAVPSRGLGSPASHAILRCTFLEAEPAPLCPHVGALCSVILVDITTLQNLCHLGDLYRRIGPSQRELRLEGVGARLSEGLLLPHEISRDCLSAPRMFVIRSCTEQILMQDVHD